MTLPLKEIAAVVLAHPQITCTRSVLSGLAEAGAAVIVCGDDHQPVGMCLPLTGYHAPARRFAAQAKASRPVCKRLWQQVVQASRTYPIHDATFNVTALVTKSSRRCPPGSDHFPSITSSIFAPLLNSTIAFTFACFSAK